MPFYLRSGKALRQKYTEVAIQFREPPHRIFDDEDASGLVPNKLRIVIQPNESIRLTIDNKKPGARLQAEAQELEYKFPMGMRDAYERLLLDAVAGDASLFTRSDEIELSWAVVDPYIQAWETELAAQLYPVPTQHLGPQRRRPIHSPRPLLVKSGVIAPLKPNLPLRRSLDPFQNLQHL